MENTREVMTEYLPQVRCTPSMRQDLERIAAQSITSNLADHIRFALEQYIEAHRETEPTHLEATPQ